MSKLLIHEPPLQVQPSLVVALGNRVDDALVVQQLHYWLQRSTNEHEGRKWVYNSYAEWIAQDFPFYNEAELGRIFRRLRDSGIVIAKAVNISRWDRRLWYTLDYDALDALLQPSTPSTPGPEFKNESSTVHERISKHSQVNGLHLTETTAENTTESIGADAPTLALDPADGMRGKPTPTPDSAPDTQPSKKKRGANRQEDTSPVVSTSSPAPLPLDFQQRAARAALDERAPVAWDDLPSASSAPSLPLPPGSVGDLDAALEWVCYGTTGDRETWALYGGQIRKARKDIREANKTLRIQITGQEIRERFAWPDGDWYATYMAKDEAGGFTRKPTPASVVKHIRALDNARVAQERTLPRAYTPAPGGGWGKAAPAPAPEPALVFTPEQLQERQERARRAYQAALDAARQREPGA